MTGAEFRRARLAARLTIRKAASDLGVSPTTIQRWEDATTVPPQAEAIATIYPPEVTDQIAYILGRIAGAAEMAHGRALPVTIHDAMLNTPATALGRVTAIIRRGRSYDPTPLMASLPATLPKRIDGDDAASAYWLGFYHQRADMGGTGHNQ